MSKSPPTVPGDNTICLPIADEKEYGSLVKNTKAFRKYLDDQINLHPELFPKEIEAGYCFHGFRTSVKLKLESRRIRLLSNEEVYQLRPDFVMPYIIGKTEDVEKGLYLRRFGVPYEGIAHVMGKDPMYWYRASLALGRTSLVGTTVKDGEAIPPQLLADEKHTWWQGEKVYVATTIADGCLLGGELSVTAGTEDLQAAYGVFAQEARELNPDYQPQTVNTDGWEATQKAWKNLFSGVTLILCFLHTILSIDGVAPRSLC